MTRKSKLTRSFVTLALLAVFATAGALFAGKGGNNPPADETPPPGTIYFDQSAGYPFRSTLKMNTDGSGKDFALPAVEPLIDEDAVTVSEPSSGLYGGRPIWLVHVNLARYYLGDNELFAVRATADGTDFEWIQITDVNTATPGVTVDFQGGQWSNDGQDTFVSFAGYLHDSQTGGFLRVLYRLEVTGNMLALAFEFPEAWTPLTAEAVDPVLADDDLRSWHDWSPDGNKALYLSGSNLRVFDTTTNTDQLIAGRSGLGKWSPDGTRIAYSGGLTVRNKTKFGIVTVNPDGSGAKLILEDKVNVLYSVPHWSPDSAHLALRVVETVQVTGSNDWNYHIGRIKADGSGLTILTGDLDPFAGKRLLGWRQ